MSESATAPHSDAAPLANDPESVYENLHAYDFMSDPEFRLGLGSILGHPGQAASDEECKSQDVKVIAAKAFYYSKYVYFDLVFFEGDEPFCLRVLFVVAMIFV